MILPVMKEHQNDCKVLMAATACLFNLVRSDLSKKMPLGLLASMMELLLRAIEMTPNHIQVV